MPTVRTKLAVATGRTISNTRRAGARQLWSTLKGKRIFQSPQPPPHVDCASCRGETNIRNICNHRCEVVAGCEQWFMGPNLDGVQWLRFLLRVHPNPRPHGNQARLKYHPVTEPGSRLFDRDRLLTPAWFALMSPNSLFWWCAEERLLLLWFFVWGGPGKFGPGKSEKFMFKRRRPCHEHLDQCRQIGWRIRRMPRRRALIHWVIGQSATGPGRMHGPSAGLCHWWALGGHLMW